MDYGKGSDMMGGNSQLRLGWASKKVLPSADLILLRTGPVGLGLLGRI